MTCRATMDRSYQGGKWIEIIYSRPIKRGRILFDGTGANYGKTVNPDAPVWRAGANQSTQLKTEVQLVVNGKTVPPGTYTMFIDLKPNAWTLIVSRWEAQKDFDENNKTQLFGAFGYTPDKDVVQGADDDGRAAVLGRSAHVAVPRHERRGRENLDHVGQGSRLRAFQSRLLTWLMAEG